MRQRFVYVAYRSGATLLALLPRRVARSLASSLAWFAWLVAPRQRLVVAKNLAPVLGKDPDHPEVRRMVRRAFVNYGLYWASAANLRASEPSRHPARFRTSGIEKVQKAAADGGGVILVLPHVGCWEAGAAWAATAGMPLTTVAEVLEPPELFEWFIEMRARMQLTVFPVGPSTAVQLIEELGKGKVIALLADRDVAGDGVAVEFFGNATRIPGGPALLALRSGAPIYPCAVYFASNGAFEFAIDDPIDTTRTGRLRADVTAVSQRIATAFESLIRRDPCQWHVFQPIWTDQTSELSSEA